MTVVFYSTNAMRYAAEDFEIHTLPSRAVQWRRLARDYPQHDFVVATQQPALFLLDGETELDSVRLVMLRGCAAHDIAQELLALRPALAIAASFWHVPYDWLGLEDALVAEELRAHGVQTMCHSAQTALDCFDKRRTQLVLQRHGFAVPRSVYVHHQLFWCERGHGAEIKNNVYKEHVLNQIRCLRFPVVIKDTVGISSYGAEVAVSYKQALHYLCSGRTKSDRIVQEFIAGEQCGLELYGRKGQCTALPPLAFSVNRYGITSPRQSMKIGPVCPAPHRMEELARLLQCDGVMQADLIFSEGKWYVIEINARLSGMSETYAAALGIPLFELLLRCGLGKRIDAGSMAHVCNVKLPLLCVPQLHDLYQIPFVRYVHQVRNKAARQEREKGYCELVCVAQSMEGLLQCVDDLRARFPHLLAAECSERARVLARQANLCYTVPDLEE